MDVLEGKVLEVYIPYGEDELSPENIGFKVLLCGKEAKIEVPVTLDTALILKGDKVCIVRTYVSGKAFFDIEKVNEDE